MQQKTKKAAVFSIDNALTGMNMDRPLPSDKATGKKDTISEKQISARPVVKAIHLFLVRHADRELQEDKIIGRSDQLDITEKGYKQAEATGRLFLRRGIKFAAVYSSPAPRAKETAKIICDAMGMTPDIIIVKDALHEMSQGDWEGKDREKIYTRKVRRAMDAQPLNFSAPNGESQLQVRRRMQAFAEQALEAQREMQESMQSAVNVANKPNEKQDEINVCFVGHKHSIGCLVSETVLKCDPGFVYRIGITNCGPIELEYRFYGKHKGWHMDLGEKYHLDEIGYASTRLSMK